MDKIAVFPGSFDPFTIGHESIVMRALPLFDRVIIAVGENAEKKNLFSIEMRLKMISRVFEGESRVEVERFSGLTVEFCRSHNARYIVRGLRTAADFEYERAMGHMNWKMAPEIDTVFLLTSTEHTPVNSTIVRDIIKHGGDVSMFVPASIRISDYLGK
ncbi:MAG TPA: pantetheine-phosphate adenylyltransferase [Bacteroidales bacterium]|jgi:pantetheine-phosphate adenylyltransferase|nr:pantetheine-phosphate adenylyltransferase [Bacteroidales bacterium]HNT92983.1 pantetheine-phosphate adenylyltransferase [Bacteroidales bacterium]